MALLKNLCSVLISPHCFPGYLEWALYLSVLVTFLIEVTKIPNQSNLRKEGLISAPSGRVQSIMMGNPWWQEPATAGHTGPRKQSEM